MHRFPLCLEKILHLLYEQDKSVKNILISNNKKNLIQKLPKLKNLINKLVRIISCLKILTY